MLRECGYPLIKKVLLYVTILFFWTARWFFWCILLFSFINCAILIYYAYINYNGYVDCSFFISCAQNTHVCAFVSPQIWNQYNGLITAGLCYFISNLRVCATTGLLRPVSSSKVITFIPSTTVVLDEHDDGIIPNQKFELLPLRDMYHHPWFSATDQIPTYAIGNILILNLLYRSCLKYFFLLKYNVTDCIGVVENLEQPVILQSRFGPRELIRFSLSDGW